MTARLTLALLVALLSGCGLKGDLYLETPPSAGSAEADADEAATDDEDTDKPETEQP